MGCIREWVRLITDDYNSNISIGESMDIARGAMSDLNLNIGSMRRDKLCEGLQYYYESQQREH